MDIRLMSYGANSFLNEPKHIMIDDYMSIMQTPASPSGRTKKPEVRPIPIRKETELPLFLLLDKEKHGYLAGIFAKGHLMSVEGEKPEIVPKHVFEASLQACRTVEERDTTLRVNERLLDQRIVVNIAADLDQTIKKYSVFPDGLAILHGPGFAFMEHEHGSARDLKKALKAVREIVQRYGSDGHGMTLSSILTPYMPIPFVGKKLNYGTWGRPSLTDEDITATGFKLDLSILKVNSIETFHVTDKPHSGFWTTDITDRVQEMVRGSGLKEGYALVTSFHTTVGIIKMKIDDIEKLHTDLLKVAPDDEANYYHNKLRVKGMLKLRSDGKALGDGNGAEPRNGRIDRILHDGSSTRRHPEAL